MDEDTWEPSPLAQSIIDCGVCVPIDTPEGEVGVWKLPCAYHSRLLFENQEKEALGESSSNTEQAKTTDTPKD